MRPVAADPSRPHCRAGQAWCHRHGSGVLRYLDVWRCGSAGGVPRPEARLVGQLGQGRAGRQSVRESDQRAALRDRSQLDGIITSRGQWSFFWGWCRDARGDGRIRAESHSGTHPCGVAPRDAQAAAHQPARGAVVHVGRQPFAVAELGAAHRLQPPGGNDPTHRPLPRWRPQSLCGTPVVVCGDDRSLPRSVRRSLPAHRVRHRRMGPWLHDHVAGARM